MKFIPLATNASFTAATRLPIGKLRDDPDIQGHLPRLHHEVIDVGRASGIALPATRSERRSTSRSRPGRDEGVDGARSRARQPAGAAWLCGKVVELGRELNVPTPSTA